MIMVHTDMDITVEEPEIQSVSRNLIEEGSDGIPVSHVSNAGPHRHIAVSKNTVSNQVMESLGPDTDNSQDPTNSTQESGGKHEDIGLPDPGPGLDPGNNATQQELNEIERNRIIKGCCLDSSDEDKVNKVVQPVTNLPEDVDS